MSLISIYNAFDEHIGTVAPTIDTVHEGQSYTPTAGVAYQELFIKPAIDENLFIGDVGYSSKGFFQITLRYPTGEGLGNILTRVEAYKALFKKQFELTKDGLKISILKDLQVVNLGVDGDRLVYAIRANYRVLI